MNVPKMKLIKILSPALLVYLLLLGITMIIQACSRKPKELTELIKESKGSVVLITGYDEDDSLMAQGTGFFVAENEIITNRHVIDFVTTAKAKLASGREYAITYVLASSDQHDLVKLGIDVRGEETRSLPLADERLSEGERVIVMGNPLGLEGTTSEGIVSSERMVKGSDTLIQITAPISPGSSGSPVLNMFGEVVGVATSQVKVGQNLNFALPISLLSSLEPDTTLSVSEWRRGTLRRWYRRPDNIRRREAGVVAEQSRGKLNFWHDDSERLLHQKKYDGLGNPVEEIEFDRNEMISSRKLFIYDEVGRVTNIRHFKGNGKLRECEYFLYRDNRVDLTSPSLERVLPPGTDTTISVVYLNSRGKKDSVVKISANRKFFQRFTYDEFGNLSSDSSFSIDPNGARILDDVSVISYQYNDVGLKTQETRSVTSRSGTEWKTETWIIRYDDFERTLRSVLIHPALPGFSYLLQAKDVNEHIYDKRGRLETVVWTMIDSDESAQGEFLTEYEYNRFGLRTRTTRYRGRDPNPIGNQPWVADTWEEYEYEYDTNSN